MNLFSAKQFSKLFAIFMVVIAMTAVTACKSTSKQESTGQYVDHSVITTKVKAAILHDKNLKVTEINVETYKCVVQLSGFVAESGDIAKAVNIARDIQGVVSVKNDIRVK